jgi:hypothetical protein
MKKIMMALIVWVWIAGTGWAADVEATPADQISAETSVAAPDARNSGSSAETADVKDSETSAMADQPTAESAVETPEKEGHSVGHAILLYIPNRILDVLDIARLRVRVGPGAAVGVRATKLVSLFAGAYWSVYAGLPGPRLEPKVSLPIGLENIAGVGVSLADLTTGGSTSPNYSGTEFGVSVHALLVGLDVGVDPVEVFDLVLGFLFIDIRGDNL